MLAFNTAHMVSSDAFFVDIVFLIRLIWAFMVLMCSVDRLGAMNAPRTLVGVSKGIGDMGIFVPSGECACRRGVGLARVK